MLLCVANHKILATKSICSKVFLRPADTAVSPSLASELERDEQGLTVQFQFILLQKALKHV